jgi:sulfonate transport system substrate-binding protein
MKRLLTALLLAGSVLAQAHAEETVRIGFQKGGGLALAVKKQGLLERALAPRGVAVKWIEFPAGPQMLEAMNAGSLDFGATGAPPPVFSQAAGADLVYVAAEPPPITSEAIIVRQDSAIRSVADLRGKRVAFQRGSGSHLLLVAALEKAGLGIRDVKPTYLAPSEARAAFEAGAIDAWVIWDPYLGAAQQAYRPRVIADRTGLLPAYGFYLTSRKLVERAPATVSTILDQFAAAGLWANTHQKEMVELMAPQVGVPKEVIATWLGRTRAGAIPVTAEIADSQQKVADLLYREKLIPRPVTIAGHVWSWKRKPQ